MLAAQRLWVQFPGYTHTDKKCITRMYCKSLWIKASAKYVNVNMRGGLELRTADETEGRHDGADHQSQTADHQGGADGTGGTEDHHSRVDERYGAEGHHSGADETGRAADHHGGAEGTEDHHSRAVGAETLGRDRDLGKTDTGNCLRQGT